MPRADHVFATFARFQETFKVLLNFASPGSTVGFALRVLDAVVPPATVINVES